MPHSPKIATCCYCGVRAALVLGEGRHELMCSACGAPLHNMKRLAVPMERSGRDVPVRREVVDVRGKKARGREDRRPRGPVPAEISGISHQPAPKSFRAPKAKRRKRKSLWKKAFEEIGDVLEDIFD